jgi:hypothetical protein
VRAASDANAAQVIMLHGLNDFMVATEAEQLAYVDSLGAPADAVTQAKNRTTAIKLVDGLINATARGGMIVSISVLIRLYEVADPDRYLKAAQAAGDRHLLKPLQLAMIRAERLERQFETPAQEEARYAAADADAEAENLAAALLVQSYCTLQPLEQAHKLALRSVAELDTLLSAVHRCVEEIGPNPGLHNLEILVRAAAADDALAGDTP